MNKNARSFMLLLTIIFLYGNVLAQGVEIPEIKGFKTDTDFPVYTPDDLWDYINGGADSYNALGFEELHIVEYSAGKKNVVKLEMYKHSGLDMAFGIYALERAPSYNFIDIGVQGYQGEGFLNFTRGQYYVKVYTHSKKKKALDAVNDIAYMIDNLIGGPGSFPSALSLFPSDGKQENTEMFISENVMGHSFLSDAYRASYTKGDKNFNLYVFKRDDADEIGNMSNEYLSRQDLDISNHDSGKCSFRDGYNGDIFLAWSGELMVLITGLSEDDSGMADAYISRIIK